MVDEVISNIVTTAGTPQIPMVHDHEQVEGKESTPTAGKGTTTMSREKATSKEKIS